MLKRLYHLLISGHHWELTATGVKPPVYTLLGTIHKHGSITFHFACCCGASKEKLVVGQYVPPPRPSPIDEEEAQLRKMAGLE